MRVFVTGATGFVGSAVTRELIAAGHAVLGLARSEDKAGALAAAGAEVLIGTVQDEELLARAIEGSDGVIHTAFNHDFSTFVDNCRDDMRVIAALARGLSGSTRPLLITSGIPLIPGGRPATEEDPQPGPEIHPRALSEVAARAAAAEGAHVTVIRLPQVHDPEHFGLITYSVAAAREKGRAAWAGDGENRFSAVHVADAALLYRLALEHGGPWSVWHAVDETGVTGRAVAEAIGARLGLPAVGLTGDEAAEHFGWMMAFAGLNLPASSRITRDRLGWTPEGPGLLDDLARLPL